MKKFAVGGIIIVLLGGYALWAASRSQSTPVIDDQNTQTTVPSGTTTQGNSNVDGGVGDSSSPGDEEEGQYKDGSYTGSVGSAAPYGQVQVSVTVSGGKMTAIKLLKTPQGEGFTDLLASTTFPIMIKEAITNQSAHVDIVSGATQNTEGFNTSLTAALQQAQI